MTFPYIMEMTESLSFNVKIDIPVNHPAGVLLADTLDILTEDGLHQVILKVDSDLLSGMEEPDQPGAFIESIAPNPFNNSTRISFSIKENMQVDLSVYAVNGQKILTLVNNKLNPGKHELSWNGKDANGVQVVSGIYLLKLETNKGTEFKKLVISR